MSCFYLLQECSTLLRTATIKNLQTINAREGVEKREPFCTIGVNVHYTFTLNDTLIMENSMEVP